MAKIRLFSDDVVSNIQTKHLNEFYKVLNSGDFLVNKVKEVIFSGQSPVSGFGRFAKYSKSYIEYIEGKAYYFKRGGKTIRVGNNPYKGKNKGKWNKLNQSISRPYPNKKKSPVNLYLSGKMMDSLRIKKDSANKVVLLGFTDKKAKYHDRDGVGKNKTLRRLLPTRQGEKFKPNINTALKKYCKDTLYQVLSDNRLSLTIKFVFSTRR